MTQEEKQKFIEIAKELQPSIDELPMNQGQYNHITYYNLFIQIQERQQREFTATCLMFCNNVNKKGIITALYIVNQMKEG